MGHSHGHDILSGFDVADDEPEYLAGLLDSGIVPAEEKQRLLHHSLTNGFESWQSLIQCARVVRDRARPDPSSLEGQDVLSYIPVVLKFAAPEAPWTRTDRLIALAKRLGEKARSEIPSLGPPIQASLVTEAAQPKQRPRRKATGHVSHYWGNTPRLLTECSSELNARVFKNAQIRSLGSACKPPCQASFMPKETEPCSQPEHTWLSLANQAATSPYFHESKAPDSQKPVRRRTAGVVSSVPFPPLDVPRFGLIQERQAHEPFWLLIAVTFLIKTRGTVAVPVFERVKVQFPSPSEIAHPDNAHAILEMIRPLGLAKNRLALLQKYANGYLTAPPTAARRYRVPGYDRRDSGSSWFNTEAGATADGGMPAPSQACNNEADAWEIGHLTKGKYALDSWRIFCRDELLGRAADWNGKGREGEFQPEWMRVRPDDKELRAYLRWLWMREGWEWDPRTGERNVLREELRRAVNEERVEYDDRGELRILDEPR